MLPLAVAMRWNLEDRLVPVPDGVVRVVPSPEVYHENLHGKPPEKLREESHRKHQEKPIGINQNGAGGLPCGLILVGRFPEGKALQR
jgi:hypothetical protein